jgi:hypothetical protein
MSLICLESSSSQTTSVESSIEELLSSTSHVKINQNQKIIYEFQVNPLAWTLAFNLLVPEKAEKLLCFGASMLNSKICRDW